MIHSAAKLIRNRVDFMAASGSAIEVRLANVFDAYTAARKISLVYLAQQFIEPSNKAAADQKHASSEKPKLTRVEAFSRLYFRLENVENDAEFKSFIEVLIAKKNNATSYEKVVVGLVHQFGNWGFPRNSVTAQTYFREAFEADAANSFAQVLSARMNYVLATGESARDDQVRSQSVSDYYVAIDGSKDAEGLAITLLALQLEHEPARAIGLYKNGISLNFAPASRYLGLFFMSQQNVASRDAYYEAALIQGDMYGLLYYFLDQGSAAKDYFVLEAATHGNYLAAYYAAEVEKQNHKLAANYYRWSLALRPSWDFIFKEQVLGHFTPLIKADKVALDVLYHYGMAFDECNYLNKLLKDDPKTFVCLWKNDYCSDRSPVMKKQAIDFLLAVNPAEFPTATNLLLAEATKQCFESELQTKSNEFKKAAAVAELKITVAPGALAAMSAIKSPPRTPAPPAPVPMKLQN